MSDGVRKVCVLPSAMVADLQRHAAEAGVSETEIVRRLLTEALNDMWMRQVRAELGDARAQRDADKATIEEMRKALEFFSAYPVETIKVTEDGRGFSVIVLRRPDGGQPTFADFDRARILSKTGDPLPRKDSGDE